jgi:choline-sulfatase
MKPSNMLFIFSDQHTRNATGCYGHPQVKTPHLDKLAAGGTRFSNAYTNGPICVPARASMATGRHVHDIGIWDNCRPYHGETPSWGHRLIEQGHNVTSIGKLHYRDTHDPNGFSEEIVPLHVIGGVGMLFTIIRDPLPVSRKFKMLVDGAGRGTSTYTDYDQDITEKTIEWLHTEASKHTDKPWTLFVSLVCPHPPWLAPDKFFDLYPPETVTWPTDYNREDWHDHPAYDDFRQFFGVKEPFDEATTRKVVSAYFGMISYLDDNIGKLLAALDENGLTDNTRILYASDHGENMGAKGLFSKCNMTEESVGVPMILSGPDVPQGKVIDTPVQLLDVFPTILEAANVDPTSAESDLKGHSLFDLANGSTPDRIIISEQHSAGAKSASFMVRKEQYKLVYHVEYPNQLFDLENDPEERVDLSSDPAFASIAANLKAELRKIMDPEEIDRQAKADQAARIEDGGGQDAIVAKGSPGYTPAPGEKPVYV